MTTTYKLISNLDGSIDHIEKRWDSGACGIPFDPANTDYQNFKYQINHDEAQLEDADGNLMTPEAAKAYVATLP
jgi:hypothetical protein